MLVSELQSKMSIPVAQPRQQIKSYLEIIPFVSQRDIPECRSHNNGALHHPWLSDLNMKDVSPQRRYLFLQHNITANNDIALISKAMLAKNVANAQRCSMFEQKAILHSL